MEDLDRARAVSSLEDVKQASRGVFLGYVALCVAGAVVLGENLEISLSVKEESIRLRLFSVRPVRGGSTLRKMTTLVPVREESFEVHLWAEVLGICLVTGMARA